MFLQLMSNVMRQIIIIISSVLLLTYCNNSVSSAKLILNIMDTTENSELQCDTSINGLLFLNNAASIQSVFGNIMPLTNKNADLPYLYVISNKKKEYLKLVVFPGSSANNVSQFEVGYAPSLSGMDIKQTSNDEHFMTESMIMLGMSKSEIIKTKGSSYVTIQKGNEQTLRYFIDNYDRSTFLKRYNMPIYFAEYVITNDHLIRYSFGFEYP